MVNRHKFEPIRLEMWDSNHHSCPGISLKSSHKKQIPLLCNLLISNYKSLFSATTVFQNASSFFLIPLVHNKNVSSIETLPFKIKICFLSSFLISKYKFLVTQALFSKCKLFLSQSSYQKTSINIFFNLISRSLKTLLVSNSLSQSINSATSQPPYLNI
jgi:hypothetical protein